MKSDRFSHVRVFRREREFGLTEWKQHKPLAAAVMESNQSHLLEDASLNSFRDSISGLMVKTGQFV